MNEKPVFTYQYKGYTGKAKYDERSDTYYGEVVGITDVITFQSDMLGLLEEEFRKSVDDYLDFCSK